MYKRFLLAGMIAVAIATTPLQSHAAENRWGIELEQEEKDLLAQALWHEAGNQTKEEQYKVVAVILNRTVDGRFGGDTVEKVIMDPGQFVGSKQLKYIEVKDEQLEIIEEVLDGSSSATTDNFNCLYFWGDGRRNHFY